MRKIGCAVVGLGAIGPTHVESIMNIENARLVAVCDQKEELAKKYADKTGAKCYTDFKDVLADPEIELVHICVPSGHHALLGIEAARAGKNVLVEKPIDITLEAADALIAACEEAGVVLSCISQHRFDDAMIAAHKALEDGRFGKITYGASYTKWYRSQAYYDSGDWRGTWELDGGGALMNQSVHYVDMLQYMCGPVDEVTAYCGTLSHDIEVEDVATAILRFKSGALGALEGNTSAFPGFCTRLDVNGTDGSVIIEADKLREWRFRDEGEGETGFYGSAGSKPLTDDGPAAGASTVAVPAASHQRQIQDVVNAIIEGRQPLVTGRDARHPLAIILAVYESSRTGKAVKVK